MSRTTFRTAAGQSIRAVTAETMRDVDRVAVEEVGLELLQMMEHAGRILAWHVRDVRESDVVIVAGSGGNGGGGLACARHLVNRDVPVRVVLDSPPSELGGAAAHQCHILDEMSVSVTAAIDSFDDADAQTTMVDALIGYGLTGDGRPRAEEYIDRMNGLAGPTVSLDVPSGIDATTGERLGKAVTPNRTVTLALPKTGLDATTGDLYLADISIPRTVYDRLGIEYESPFGDDDWIRLDQ